MEKSMILSKKNAKWKRGAQWEKARKEHEPLWIKCHFKNDDPWGSSKGNVKKNSKRKRIIIVQ